MSSEQPDLVDAGVYQLPEQPAATAPEFPGWYDISFFGHIQETGLVSELTLHGDRHAYRIEFPDKVWGNDAQAWADYDASAFFSKRPVNPEVVYAEWADKRQRALAARLQRDRWAREQAERETRLAARALEAGPSDPDAGGGDPDDSAWASREDYRELDGSPC